MLIGRLANLVAANSTADRRSRRSQHLRALKVAAGAHEAILAAVIQGMPDGIMILDADLKLVEWNGHFPEFIGIPADKLRVGMNVSDILRVQAEAGEFGPVDIDDEIARRMSLWRTRTNFGVIERKRPNGRTMELRRSELPEGGFVTLYSDITARRDAEDRLRQSQKMEAIGNLSGGIAHDFNNVLQSVAGCAALIQQDPDDPRRVERLAKLIADSARRGASISKRLLAFSRRDELRAEPLAVAEMLDGLREILTHTLGASIEIRTEVHNDLFVLADRGQLETVLLNLAANARDAMPDGGTLTLRAAAEQVLAGNTHSLSPGQYVKLSVSDTGSGVDPSILPRLAEPFFTTKPPGKGTGLGLAMAKGFAEQSRGILEIESRLGAGTAISVWLPKTFLVPSEMASAPPAPDKPELSQTIIRLLLVDDDPFVLETFTEFLMDRYVVVPALSGAEALALLRSGEPANVLVTDLKMPGIDGLQLIQQAQTLRSSLHAILLTGYAGDIASSAVSNAVAGSFSLLRKPITRSDLVECIDALVASTCLATPDPALSSTQENSF